MHDGSLRSGRPFFELNCAGLTDEVLAAEFCGSLRETMTRLKWSKSRAASVLGLSRVGLRTKPDRYGIEPSAALAGED